MTKHILPILIILFFITTSTTAYAQTSKTKSSSKKTVVKIDQLEVIYTEDDDYSDIIIDQPYYSEDNEPAPARPSILPPPPLVPQESEYNNPDRTPQLFQSIDDEGAENEDEIIYASFDSETIHYPKLDINDLDQPFTIQLCNPAMGEEFHYPTPITARTSSHFGPRRRRFHYGLDLAAPTGTPIYSMFNGKVRISKYNKSYGNLIVIRHDNGLETYYAHLSERKVVPGDDVKAGDVIGLCGNTGRSYGSHLHLEIRYKGNAMNPENVIDCSTHDLLSHSLYITKESFRKTGKASNSYAKNKSKNKSKPQNKTNGSNYYRVRSGDNLSKIASRNGTTVQKLCQLNKISRNSTLQIGQKLRLR